MLAASEGHEAVAEVLLQKRVDILAKNDVS
mgnify:CR=1 FL=1